jgi:hypothetical protein
MAAVLSNIYYNTLQVLLDYEKEDSNTLQT